ncbi:hypothetical protein FCF25_14950 [Haloprofundus sp. MHR1]|nr:hypothetical protein FCF25_14950 [Haloprofundus sp. MHR1]
MTQYSHKFALKRSRATELTATEYHRLHASKQRRTALDVLESRNPPVDLEELAAAIAARAEGMGTADDEAIDRIALRLHHAHLPMMADLGVIDYDPDVKSVEFCPRRSDSRTT